MPLFEYKCDDCGKLSEFLEKSSSSNAKHNCPFCGGKKLIKQFSTFSAVVKQAAAGSNCHSCPSSGSCPHSGL